MGISDISLGIGDVQSLNQFDVITNVAFGDDDTTPSSGDTTLANELLRVADIVSTKDLGNNTYEFVARVPITKLNSSTIKELGIFDAATSGNMGGRILSPAEVTKTSSEEILFTIRVETQTENN